LAATTPTKKTRRPPVLQPKEVHVDGSRLAPAAAERLVRWQRQLYRLAAQHVATPVEAKRELAEAITASAPLNAAQWALVGLTERLQPVIDLLAEWSPEEQDQLLEGLESRYATMAREDRFNLDLRDACTWLRTHQDDGPERAEAVLHCISLDAPSEVQIERRLPQAGSQKRVFKARWTVADDPTDIVLKQFLGESESILLRERRPHPLSMTHPNIIETFTIANQASTPETFLVERWIDVLDDNKKASGWSDAARLLVDMARALAFLADQGLVHGDVKPDNIGYYAQRFVLLDFGICRPAGQFASATQTGSLRTRAPEVLLDEHAHSGKIGRLVTWSNRVQLSFRKVPAFQNPW